MSELAGLLGSGETVLLVQAGTPTQTRLIRERVTAAGGRCRGRPARGDAGRWCRR